MFSIIYEKNLAQINTVSFFYRRDRRARRDYFFLNMLPFFLSDLGVLSGNFVI